MSRIEWDETLSVHNDEMDEQHKKWISIHNRLHDVLIGGTFDQIEKTGADTLQAMQEYVRYHFQYEEEYMKKINFPGVVEHRRIHKDFDNQIYKYNRELLEGKIILRSEIMKVLKNWLLEHIMHEDQKYCLFLENSLNRS
jgi:hemerythrin